MHMLRRLVLLVFALLLVAAGAPDLVHAQQPEATASHVHADGAPPDHDHVAEQCVTACHIAPAVVPVAGLPAVGRVALRVVPSESVSPQPEQAPPEPRPPRRTQDLPTV